MKLVFNGKVKESGQLHIFNRQKFIDEVAALFLGKQIVITVERKKKKRSLSQNAYYWSVVVPIVKDGLVDVGYKVTSGQTHELLKDKFLIEEIINEQSGEIIEIKGTTTNLTTTQMMDYFAEITQWAVEFLNVQIPEPNEILEIPFKDEKESKLQTRIS